ncbi:hypothetical protein DSO57_1011885 [Entomophthora muscae]|uniref:Uncharacterized protein n=1 Tax=Entomophthora muscae TaxID=34485 RepID=A0ACC2RX19_9FUNG|nr:hypothetical protein DSO57_1011885 [Entomophthora muscae]
MEEVDSVEVIMKFCTLLAFIASGTALPTQDTTNYNDQVTSSHNVALKHYDENNEAFDKSLNYEEIVEVTKKLLQSRKDEFTGSDKLYAGNEDKKHLISLNNHYAQNQGKYIRSNAKKALQNANVTGYSFDEIKIKKKNAIISLNEEIGGYMESIKDFCIKESSEENCRGMAWPGHDEDIPLDDDSIDKSDPRVMVTDISPGNDDDINKSPSSDTIENKETDLDAQDGANINGIKEEQVQKDGQKDEDEKREGEDDEDEEEDGEEWLEEDDDDSLSA